MNLIAHRNGFALPTLILMLALASTTTLLAMRNAWLNEQLLNAEADQRRTELAAEALLPVALADIVGTLTDSDSPTTLQLRHTAGDATHTHAFFPSSLAAYDVLRQRLVGNTCSLGICAPHALNASANQASVWKSQTDNAISVGAAHSPYGDNMAWYWVEVFPQSNTNTFVYRITTLAHGVFPNSSTVLQAVWSRPTDTSLTGQWHSWQVLHD